MTGSMHINSENVMVLSAIFNIMEFLRTNVDMSVLVIRMIMSEARPLPISSIINYVENFKEG